ncbi:MAG: ESPR domain-containing protein, partial [Polaromonas sp.]|nr:ESPR domain-containing protein [Polaromonas sp.]
MNRIYRLVWNASLNLWVAVAENARGRGKGGSVRSSVLFGSAAMGDAASGFTLSAARQAALSVKPEAASPIAAEPNNTLLRTEPPLPRPLAFS